MRIFSKKLIKSKELERKIELTCSFNGAKVKFIQGKVLTVATTNISFIEPHRAIVNIKGKKLLFMFYDKDSLFLYSRRMPIEFKRLDTILKKFKEEVSSYE